MNTALQLTGSIFVLLALMHVIFPKYFNWKKDLSKLSLINKQMMEVHTFFIALTVLLMGLLCLFFPSELHSTSLGKAIAAALSIFWFLRLLIQLFWYSPELWKGKAFETIIHIVFTGFWIWCTGLFLYVFISN